MKNSELIARLTTLKSALNKAQFKLAQPLTNRAFYLDFLIRRVIASALTFFIACALKVRPKIIMLRSSYRSLQAVAVMAVLVFAAGSAKTPGFRPEHNIWVAPTAAPGWSSTR